MKYTDKEGVVRFTADEGLSKEDIAAQIAYVLELEDVFTQDEQDAITEWCVKHMSDEDAEWYVESHQEAGDGVLCEEYHVDTALDIQQDIDEEMSVRLGFRSAELVDQGDVPPCSSGL